MSTEKMREEFEAWLAKKTGNNPEHFASYRSGKDQYAGTPGDGYARGGLEIGFLAWQASRAAIEVELPEAFCAYGGQGHHGSDPDDAYIVEDVVRAIESLGLKVKS